ncbi:hypothetical protein K438DRAFT_1957170 [Mycena galopus ATCC 62051]|nr:hypothetical protein K438DRAFT_1957170 [Mycena galopus ATCC 62051]
MSQVNGPADLQRGERWTDLDFVFAHPLLALSLSDSTLCPPRPSIPTQAPEEEVIDSNPLPFQPETDAPSILPFLSPPSFIQTLFSIAHSSNCRLSPCHLRTSSMPCVPPFYPSHGHENMLAHDNNLNCMYYAVWNGRVRGWIARGQMDGWTDAQQKGFKRWADLLAWWSAQCNDHHQGGCPPFKHVTFTLDSSSTTHPSSAPCSRVVPAPMALAVALAPAAALMSPVAAAPPIVIAPASPPAYAAGPSSSMASSFSSTSSFTSSDSLFASSPTQVKKEEPRAPALNFGVPPRVTLETRVQLTPTGRARGAALVEACAANAPTLTASLATPRPADRAAAPIPSVQLTPQPAAPGTAPAPHAVPVRIPTKYRIRGVPIFYPNAKIMVSAPGQPEKLEAYMLGKLFVGEDVAAPNAE